MASSSANVRSLEALRLFRPAVIQFEAELKGVFGALRHEIDRTLDWLDHDCPHYWKQQVRTSFDRVAAARTELARKQIITVAGHRAECIDEKKALRDAKRRLEQAQEMINTIRSWSIKAHRAADEYNCQLGRIEQVLAQNIPQALNVLNRIIASIESYVETAGASPSPPEVVDEAYSADADCDATQHSITTED